MKNYFSFRRIGLMLKADWIEYKMAFFIFFASLLVINLFLFQNMREGFQVFLFCGGITAVLMFFYMVAGWKVHRAKNRILTLPASTPEKFVEILLIGFILSCVFLVLYMSILWSSHLVSGEPVWFMSGFHLNTNPADANNKIGIEIILFICSFFFMCCIAFRKFPLGIGFLMLISFASIISYTAYLFVRLENLDFNNFQNGFIQSNALLETTRFLFTYNAWGMMIASAVLLYISYLKLKEKQIR